MIALVSGFAAGLVHVLSGPDHLAAVAPLTMARRKRAWLTGLRWGLGHASGVVGVGLLALVFRELLPLPALTFWAERLVGVVLIGVGLWGLRIALTAHVHTHEHVHDGQIHMHIHVHGLRTAHEHGQDRPHRHGHAAFAIGVLHGLAGSSHFLGVLPALAMPTTLHAVSYLAAYGVGTVVAMSSFSWMVGRVAGRVALGAYRTLLGGCSLAAVAVGGFWLAA
jgi:hypothetical protein